MKEKLLENKKKGMLVLILTTLLYVAAIAGCVFGGILVGDGRSPALLVISIVWVCLGMDPVLRTESAEAAGGPCPDTVWKNIVGTLKNEGFYYVNPFCTSVNPAADTHLHQSGDVDNSASKVGSVAGP